MGVSLYELVTGKRPFDGDSQFAIMSAHLQGTPVPPVSVDPRLPQLLNDVILMSVAKDANARFQTAGALRNALSNVVPALKPAEAAAAPAPGKTPAAARPVTAVPVGQMAPAAQAQAARPASHRGAWMGLGAVVALLAIVAVIAIAPGKVRGPRRRKSLRPQLNRQFPSRLLRSLRSHRPSRSHKRQRRHRRRRPLLRFPFPSP